MKLSTKGRYGLRTLIDLAVHAGNGHVSLRSIAERQDISVNYLEQVFSLLRKAGLVKSIKGAQGGYILVVRPSSLKIGTVLRILEGDLSVSEIDGDCQPEKNSVKYCISVNVWEKINERINRLVDSITLEDLVNEYKSMNGYDSLMYYI